jgi:hypothetical protein
MLDPKVYDVLAKAIREVARGFPNGNVSVNVGLKLHRSGISKVHT